MKSILILVASLNILGCAAGSFPRFPEGISTQYVVDVRGEDMPHILASLIVNLQDIPESSQKIRCLKFHIIETNPYQIQYVGEVPLKECNGVGGYKPSDTVSLYNWIDDVHRWARDRKNCFKER